MSILDHISVPVTDIQRSRAFYEAALAPLGITALMDYGVALGLGRDQMPQLWLAARDGGADGAISPMHVAIAARSREEVDAFHAAAIAAGGRDNGGPGLRPQYHAGYYGAFVLDPDGHNLEAVIHRS